MNYGKDPEAAKEAMAERERQNLCDSPIACLVGDEWAALTAKMTRKPLMPRTLREALDQLEAITHDSPLRKVKP